MPNKYLSNMALILTTIFCKVNKIDCSGTHLVKYPRKQTYALVKDGSIVVIVTLYTNQTPTYSYNK